MKAEKFNNLSFRAMQRFVIKSLTLQCQMWRKALIRSIPKNKSQGVRFRRYGKWEDMKSSEIEPIVDKVSLPHEFYEDYHKRIEIEVNGVLLGLIDNPIDIKLYHKLYQDLQAEISGESRPNKSTPQRFMNLLKKYAIEMYILPAEIRSSEGWSPSIWHIFKDKKLIAEIGHA